MGFGLLRTALVLTVASALVAGCATIIGIDGYSIDPELADGGDPGVGATTSDGGSGVAVNGGQGGAGETSGTAAAAGEGGAAGTGSIACDEAACDDEIECTVDTCDENGQCAHAPDSTLCDVDPGECVTCEAGIGCTARDVTQIELLLDPHFDLLTGDWDEVILDNVNQVSIVSPQGQAQSPSHAAVWVPVPDPVTAPDQGYADLLQAIVLPEGIQELRLTGFYRLTGGAYAPNEDYVSAALFRPNGTTALVTFHDWFGDDADQSQWVMFDYVAPKAELEDLIGDNLTFDLYGYTWDSSFYFDTLSLTAGVCQ
jgi:hypothetical protein